MKRHVKTKKLRIMTQCVYLQFHPVNPAAKKSVNFVDGIGG